MNQVLVWSIVALILIALVFYLVTVESDAELDPLRQEGGIRGFVKSFKNGLHRPPAPEPIDTDLTGFLAAETEAGPAYVEPDRVAARITHHTKTGYQLVRNTVNPFIGEDAQTEYPTTPVVRNRKPVADIPSEPVRPLPGSQKIRFKFPKRAVVAEDIVADETGDDLFDEPEVRPFVEFDDSAPVLDAVGLEESFVDEGAAYDAQADVELAEPVGEAPEAELVADAEPVVVEESDLVSAGVTEAVGDN